MLDISEERVYSHGMDIKDQSLSDLAYHAKELTKAYAEKQYKAGKAGTRPVRNRLDAWDSVEILHAIARYMVIHNVER